MALQAREHSRRLYQLYMIMNVFWETVGKCSDGGIPAFLVSPNVIFLCDSLRTKDAVSADYSFTTYK